MFADDIVVYTHSKSLDNKSCLEDDRVKLLVKGIWFKNELNKTNHSLLVQEG